MKINSRMWLGPVNSNFHFEGCLHEHRILQSKKTFTYITWYNDKEINMNVDRDEMFHSELWCFKLIWKMTLLKTFFPILFSIVNILIAKIQLTNMRVVIHSGTFLNQTLSKPKTWLNQTDFTVASTKCLCNLNLCKPNTCLN